MFSVLLISNLELNVLCATNLELNVLCATHLESHSHLFADCHYSRIIFLACPGVVNLNWNDFKKGRFISSASHGLEKDIGILYLSAAFYAIWTERNNRIHRNVRCSLTSLIHNIRCRIREKLYSSPAFHREILRDPTVASMLY